VNPWVKLYQEHTALREQGREAVTAIRRALRDIGEKNPSVFSAHAHQRLQPRKNSEKGLKTYQLNNDGCEVLNLAETGLGGHGVRQASLTVLMLLNVSTGHLHALTLMVEATKADGLPWTMAVHLPNDQGENTDHHGYGACGHAALHCHVGPTLDEEPKIRVPLPAVNAGELVGWLVSQVVPTLDFERAPWSDVGAALEPPGK